MLNELRDLDGTVVARQRSLPDDRSVELILSDFSQTISLDSLEAIQTLRDLCDEILDDQGASDMLDTSPGDLAP